MKNYKFILNLLKCSVMSTDTHDSNPIAIEIDCAPGGARPNVILELVLATLPVSDKAENNLSYDDFLLTNTFFGEWTFTVKRGREGVYQQHKVLFGQALKKFHEKGVIRFASW